MAMLTNEHKEFIKNVGLCIIASADKNGVPNASYKGTLSVLDDEHLVFADIFSAKTRKNLLENNKVCVLMGDLKTMEGYQFVGEAELLNSGELYDAVSAKVIEKKFPKPVYVVKIKINEIFYAGVKK
ncbi:pyridoxamine 5'-phosphate oxidase family protein [Dehalobacterium formicoaceticum]|uniref:Pyridoxamine 5'-phosphate oxidase family protein n=1 Tax=Dehalobacterium formicoaceticum TaxID=51515 RepID=A0ABT1Y4H1_9FIRM|nr:pyridoxamine 5'-phosphate oxidase family protein [Dehalobacterium formicoaceticum]MCR6544809.1 pyridoxamine 5'-phosphate oxidase family protein [Dehalobacterium formicoaceticum]